MSEYAQGGCGFPIPKWAEADPLPKCPKCGAEDSMEHCRHRFSTESGPNVPDADWDECVVCGYRTDPE